MAPKAILTTGLLLVLTLPLGSGQGLGTDIVELPAVPPVEADGDKTCGIPDDSETGKGQEVLAESDWTLGTHVAADGSIAPMATKVLSVRFASDGSESEPMPSPSDAESDKTEPSSDDVSEPTVEIRECSSGVCTVTVHVYVNSTTTVKAGIGFWAFLPYFFRIGGEAAIEERVSSYSETKIECAGEMFIGVKFSGGVGPQTGAASILASNAKQEQEACTYLNIPGVDDSCTIPWKHPFEVTASHPGNYTRFDVVNGGRFSVQPAALSALAIAHTSCVAGVRVHSDDPMVPGVATPPVCFAGGGEWRAVFGAIDIDVDAREAAALLADAVTGNLPTP